MCMRNGGVIRHARALVPFTDYVKANIGRGAGLGAALLEKQQIRQIYLMTLFARERNSGESVSPICFAAFKLMTNSNFVACCTGRSAGLAPFKILST